MTNDTEKTSIAAHLYILMRRHLNRVIDVEWLLHNDDYAREIIKLASPHAELAHLAERMQGLLFAKAPAPAQPVLKAVPALVMQEDEPEEEMAAPAGRYIGTLR